MTAKAARDIQPGDVVWAAHASPAVVTVEAVQHGRGAVWISDGARWVWLVPDRMYALVETPCSERQKISP